MNQHCKDTLWGRSKPIVGMVHVRALPGTPHANLSIEQIIATAVEEARMLADAGCDALIIENMHDRPYKLRRVGPEIVAGMTAVGRSVKAAVNLPLGVQILAGANIPALAVALACDAQFIRAEGFVFAHVADEGLMDSADAARLLRYRRFLVAEQIAVWADVKKKHSSHALTADVDLPETARAAEFFGADAVIVTGTSTAAPASPSDAASAAQAVDIPVAIGSGLTPETLPQLWDHAAAFIVGSYIKQGGLWSNPIDPDRLAAFMDTVTQLRHSST